MTSGPVLALRFALAGALIWAEAQHLPFTAVAVVVAYVLTAAAPLRQPSGPRNRLVRGVLAFSADMAIILVAFAQLALAGDVPAYLPVAGSVTCIVCALSFFEKGSVALGPVGRFAVPACLATICILLAARTASPAGYVVGTMLLPPWVSLYMGAAVAETILLAGVHHLRSR